MALLPTKECDEAEIKTGQYKMPDGQGLSLLIHPNGSKYWTLAYRLQGKHKTKSLGKYPDISLKKARQAAN